MRRILNFYYKIDSRESAFVTMAENINEERLLI